MIVFAGRDSSGDNLNDVWILTNANGLGGTSQWINLIPNGASGSPPARSGHSAAYDNVDNILIIFGGCSGYCAPALNDVWTLSNANGLGGTPVWTQLSAGGGPAPRTNAAAAYDPVNNRLIVYSGQDGSAEPCSTFADIWFLADANGLADNFSGWTGFTQFSVASPLTSPSPGLNGGAVAYNPATSILTIFGGITNVSGVCRATNGTWELNVAGYPSLSTVFANGAAGSPPARSNASAVYDPTGGRMLVFGGLDKNTELNDVWGLFVSGAPAWEKLTPSGAAPPVRSAQAAVFDTVNQRMAVFGGSNTSGVLDDTWVLTAPLPYPPLSCLANAGAPNIVHVEGITDQVGDLILNCVGGAPTPLGQPIPEYKVTLNLNTNVTSRPLPESGGLSEALLTLDEPFPAAPVPSFLSPVTGEPGQIVCEPLGSTCSETGTGGSPTPYETQPNTFVGKQTGVKTLQWKVPIDAPGPNSTRVIRLTNVRAAAHQLGVPSGFLPTEVQATVAIQGSQAVAIANMPAIVGVGNLGLVMDAPPADPILQCVPHNASLAGGSSTGTAAFDFTVPLAEGFPYSFLYRNYGTFTFGLEYPEPLSEQNVLGFQYRTETGFYSPSLFTSAPAVGLPDSGTRIRIKFSSLPAGVHLFVPATITMTGNYGESTQGEAQLVQANENGLSSSPGYQPVAATAMVGTTPVAEVSYSGSVGYATYEVVYADPSVVETVPVSVAVAFNASPATGQAEVAPSFAPIDSVSTATTAAPLPRFASIYAAEPAFSIQSCPASTLAAVIASKTGPDSARVWDIQVNSGANAANAAEIASFTIVHSSGPNCTPAVTSPAFPVSLGDIAANGSVTTPVTIDFGACSSSARFKVSIQLSANGGVSNKTVVLSSQAP